MTITPDILVVDDERGVRLGVEATLISESLGAPTLAADGDEALARLREGRYRVALLDLIMPGMDGLSLLEEIQRHHPGLVCVVMTAVDDVETAVRAMKLGAFDYLVKPVTPERLVLTVRRAKDHYLLHQGLQLYKEKPSFSSLAHPEAFAGLVAADEAMALVFHQVENVAPTDYSVVITGETGTGKERIARIIHALSPKSSGPFLAVNMAASNRALFEDMFFGHARGAFTGADADRKGYFEQAQGGTIFLDEVSELDGDLQAKLLRVIQEREIQRLGEASARPVDVRVLAATNRNLSEEVGAGRFRNDLYYRLSTALIHLPPLRRRVEDILPIADHFLAVHAKKTGKRITALAAPVKERLRAHSFPGNVRELENLIAGAILHADPAQEILTSLPGLAPVPPGGGVGADVDLTLEQLERRQIERVLAATGQNRTHAARRLGISVRTLQRKILAYGL